MGKKKWVGSRTRNNEEYEKQINHGSPVRIFMSSSKMMTSGKSLLTNHPNMPPIFQAAYRSPITKVSFAEVFDGGLCERSMLGRDRG